MYMPGIVKLLKDTVKQDEMIKRKHRNDTGELIVLEAKIQSINRAENS